MSNIIDRRLNPRDKTIKNRQKFIQRGKQQIKEAVKEAIDDGKIADIEDGKIRVKVKGIDEPTFHNNPKSGDKQYVLPGNKKHVVGDRQKKPEEDEGGGGSQAGRGQSEDDFEFVLNQEEFLDFIFEDLELPDLIKKQMRDVTKSKPHRAGYTNVGNPSQLDVVRSLKNSLGRRIGLRRPKDEEIEALEKQLEETEDPTLRLDLEAQIELLRNRQHAVPWLDPFDVRYRNYTNIPQPMTQAVMFCIMDVSASMGKREKELAKRFFFFLHMFLRRKYTKVEIVFIRHHEEAKEVDEQEFFTSKESGGTVVSSALQLTKSIIDARYNVNDWNIYIAQASDGDNDVNDNKIVKTVMEELLSKTQYFAYVEIQPQAPGAYFFFRINNGLFALYHKISQQFKNLTVRGVTNTGDVWKVFLGLFSKEKSNV